MTSPFLSSSDVSTARSAIFKDTHNHAYLFYMHNVGIFWRGKKEQNFNLIWWNLNHLRYIMIRIILFRLTVINTIYLSLHNRIIILSLIYDLNSLIFYVYYLKKKIYILKIYIFVYICDIKNLYFMHLSKVSIISYFLSNIFLTSYLNYYNYL